MSICIKTGHACCCQPDEGAWCPDYKPDRYVIYLMKAIEELIEQRNTALNLMRERNAAEAACTQENWQDTHARIMAACEAMETFIEEART